MSLKYIYIVYIYIFFYILIIYLSSNQNHFALWMIHNNGWRMLQIERHITQVSDLPVNQ